jgi:hypothetical protein
LPATSFSLFKVREAVFVEGVTHFEGALAQGDVVSLRSGEVLHGRAERFRRKQANVHLQIAAQAEADFVVALGDDVHERRIFCDVLH